MIEENVLSINAQDFFVKHRVLSNEEIGVFCTLLFHQTCKGYLPKDTKKLSRLVVLDEEDFLVIWKELEPLFDLDEEGYKAKHVQEYKDGLLYQSYKYVPNHQRKTPDYRYWKQAVLDRDKVCQNCGTDKFLEAHHIKSFARYPKLRTELSNGICLCKKCHKLEHQKK